MQQYYLLLSFGVGWNRYYNQSRQQSQMNSIIPPNFKILIIDNDIDFLKALEYRLSKKKIDVVTVESGFTGIEVLKDACFDLILLDLKMPELNGAETFKKIIQIKTRHFVIIMTAQIEDEQVKVVKKLKPFGFLEKPFGLSELMVYIEKRIKEEKNDN